MASAKEGYLTKLGAKFPTWRRRYFVLLGSRLYYFKTLKDRRNNRIQGVIALHKAQIGVADHVEKEFAFQVRSENASRTYLICAGSAAERDEWVAHIQSHTTDDMAKQPSSLKRDENSLREGYLTKLGEKVKNWKRRYFVLADNVLKYYASQSEAQALGTIVLLGSRVQLEEKSIVGIDNAFSVTLADGRRRYIMYADTPSERMLWFDAIKKCRVFNSTLQQNEDASSTPNETVPQRLTVANVMGATGHQGSSSSGPALKQKVSKKKRRFVLDGFDLDLTYITDRIIAMGYPSENIEAMYRNSISEVRRFLDNRHQEHYRVYNLCSERSYDSAKFAGNVVRFPFDDHNCPRFEDLVPLCEDMNRWMQADERNVCAVHCKAGKGRTGLVICVFLLYSGAWQSAQEALSYYAYVRTRNQKGVTIPSQRRWVYYFEKYMERRRVNKAIPDRGPIVLNEIVVSKRCKPFDYIEIVNNGVKYTSKSWGKYWKQQASATGHATGNEAGGFLIKPPRGKVRLHRDFKVECFATGLMGKRTRVWSFWANTCFIDSDHLALDKTSLDKACKDKDAPFFRVEVFFNEREKQRTAAGDIQALEDEHVPQIEEMRRRPDSAYVSSDESGDEEEEEEDEETEHESESKQKEAVVKAMEALEIEHDEVFWWSRPNEKQSTSDANDIAQPRPEQADSVLSTELGKGSSLVYQTTEETEYDMDPSMDITTEHTIPLSTTDLSQM